MSDLATRSELWESDGTPAGTNLFKAFSPILPTSFPFIFLPFNFTNFAATQPLFQGNKFFFSAGTTLEGTELWISDGVDGTATHTHIVKDINPGTGDGIDFSIGDGSYLYTSNTFFFGASDATHGSELWQTDGTSANTTMVKDINPGMPEMQPLILSFLLQTVKYYLKRLKEIMLRRPICML